MTPRELLTSFETLADAPDGVKRLRELVLQLAVRGKLVPQEPTDEPASKILERAEVQRAQLQVRRPRNLPELSEDQLPYSVPQGWVWTCNVAIGDVAPRNSADAGAVAAFLPMPVIPTEYGAKVIAETRLWSEIRNGYTHVSDGDIAVAKITPCFQNGKACVISDLPGGLGAGTTELYVLRPFRETVDPRYVLAFYKSPDFIRGGVETFTGTAGQQRVSSEYFNYRPFPLPPLNEQHRIVARVDELMGLLDRLEAARTARDAVRRAARDAALAALRDAGDAEAVAVAWARVSNQMDDVFIAPEDVPLLRQTILQLAVQGRLTKDDPVGWSEASLGDILVDGPTNGWSPRAVEYPTGVMSLKLSATTRGYFDSTQFKYVEPDGVLDARLWLMPGDLLVQRSNTPEYVGVSAIFDGPERTYIYPDLMMRCRISPEHDVRFVHMAISAPDARNWISARASGTSQSMVKINQATVRSVSLRLPPLERQRCIVETAKRFFVLCDQLEARLAAARELQAQFAAAAVHHLDV